jgi:membrane glycosyltransferase
MTDAAYTPLPGAAQGRGATPAGLQSRRDLTRRRITVAVLNLVTLALVLWGASQVFGAGGWSVTDIIIVACVCFGAPWTVMGVWNAVIGLWLLHGVRGGVSRAAPHLAAGDGDAPIRLRVAVAMTLRNEPPARALARLAEVRRSLDATGQGAQYKIFVLSDTDDPAIAAEEEAAMAGLDGAVYRRRATNEGFKAGNVRDFLRNDGRAFDLFLPLDSDSLMSGGAIDRLASELRYVLKSGQ